MSKFNRSPIVTAGTARIATSPVQSISALSTTRTHQGGAGWARDARSELFLLAVSHLAGESTFYEAGTSRDERLARLAGEIACEDVEWLTRLTSWVRGTMNLRSVALMLAAEGVAARLAANLPGGNRQLVAASMQRADEPGELLAYWVARHGRNVPKPVKRGVADAAARLYTERALLKWDSAQAAFRFGDVLEITHASPVAPWQGELFAHAIDRRHNRPLRELAALPLLAARAQLLELPLSERRSLVTSPEGPARLEAAAMSWEALAGWLQGPLDASVWEAVIPSMGYMALLRNLRNFDEAGVADRAAAEICARLADPDAVASSRQLPLRFLSAYRAAPSLRWGGALERALEHSLGNVPALPGRTLVLVDRSGSMFSRLSARSELSRADAAALFGSSLALRAGDATLVEFGSTSRVVQMRRSESPLRMIERFTNLGGTSTAEAVRSHYHGHDRVLIVTDEQAGYGYYGSDPTSCVPASTPVYTWNVAGYAAGHAPSGTSLRHTFGGLTDAAFQAIPLLERGTSASWPF